MFTVKFMKGLNNETIKIVDALDVEIRMFNRCDNSGSQHAIILTRPGAPACETEWQYLGHPDWDMAVVENSHGKTTEVVRAPMADVSAGQQIGRVA